MEYAAENDPELDGILLIGFEDFQFQLTVVDQYALAHFDVAGKAFVAHIDLLHRSFAGLVDEGQHVAFRNGQTAVFHLADPQFRALQIGQDADVKSVFVVDVGDMIDDLFVIFVRTVGKVQAKNVYARLNQFEQGFVGTRGWAYGRYDLGILMVDDLHNGLALRNLLTGNRKCTFYIKSRIKVALSPGISKCDRQILPRSDHFPKGPAGQVNTTSETGFRINNLQSN